MTIDEFCNTYVGKKIDFDNFAGAQCVDLFRQCAKDVHNVKEKLEPCSTSGGAKDLYLDYDKMPLTKKYFARSPSKNYKLGDFLIWGSTSKNKYGHVAVFITQVRGKVLVFEQDGFAQDGAKYTWRSVEGLLGYLRKKNG